MEYRKVQGLNISRLGLGCVQLGESGVSEDQVATVLNTALDNGITLIDSARAYGLAEERIGRHIAQRRDEFTLASKGGYGVGWVPDWSYESIMENIEDSLRKMRTDHIDIYFLHSCSEEILRRGEVIQALLDAEQQGKILHPAYSGENDALSYAIGTGAFRFIETSVNICDQRGIELFLPAARSKAMGIIAKRPIANAFWRFSERPVGEYCLPYWDRAQEMGLDPGEMPWDELALRFSLGIESADTLIVGTSSPAHLLRNLEILAMGPLHQEWQEKLRRIFPKDIDWAGQI